MARNAIKGLTIEIGGDTKGLQDAIQDVEKKSMDLSKELRDINKLLKMDPGNTDLVAQKQKVLAEAIENCSQKLKTLKEAEKQVQKQFKKGEVSAEQVRALQREISDTEQTLGRYKKEAKNASKNVKDLGDASEKAEKSSKNLGSTLANAAKVGLAAVGAAAGAAIAGLTAAAENSREYRTEMGKLDTAFKTAGLSATQGREVYTDLVGVLGETDQAVEAAGHLAKLTKNQKELSAWSDICTGVFATFGDSLPIEGLTEAANETAKVGQVTGPLADALNWAGVSEDKFNESLAKCNSEQERASLITKTLSGLYGDAAATYKETNSEVIRANIANDMWMESLAGVGGAVEPIITDVKRMGAAMLSEAVPGVKALADAFRGLLNGEDGAAANFGEALSGLISGLLQKVTEMLPTVLQVGVTLITTLVQSIAQQLPLVIDALVQVIPQLITALLGMLPMLLESLIGMVSQIINGLAAMLPEIVAAVVKVVPQIIDALLANLPALLDAAITLLMAIVDAVPKIITELANALPSIVDKIANFLTSNIDVILDAAIKMLMALIKALPTIIKALTGALPKIIKTIVAFLVNNIDTLVEAAITMFMAIIEAIPEICDALVSNLPQIIGTIVDGLVKAIPKIASAALDLGAALVKGLWEGVKNLGSWLWGKLTGWAGDIVGWIADKLKINSPSRVFRDDIGENIGLGVAEGVERSTGAVRRAMGSLGDAAMNGLAIERGLQNRSAQMYTASATAVDSGLLAKLDHILAAIEAGQVLALDGKELVGRTATQYDGALGQRRILAARGAI